MAGKVPAVVPAEVPEEAEVVLYRVVSFVTVIRLNKKERYINRGGVFSASDLDPENAEHLLRIGHIEVVEPDDE